MGNLIVKDNAFVEASYSLDTVEQRLIFLAILEARKLGDNIEQVLNQTLTIHAQSYMQQFDVARNTAYEALKRGVNGLFEAEFNYTQFVESSKKVEFFRSRFVQKISYVDELGVVRLIFANDVVPLIVGLEKKFTKYEIEQIKGLQSRYAIRLYELLIKWRSKGRTDEISMSALRNCFGLLDDEYNRMDNFKRKVLDIAIEQINEHTDIIAEYEQHKQGRTITGFTFKFKQKDKPKQNLERDPDTIDWVNGQTDNEANGKVPTSKTPSWQTKGLTDAQIKKLAIYTKEFVDANSSKIAPNDRRDYAPIFDDWKPLLKDPKTVTTFHMIQELLDRKRIH